MKRGQSMVNYTFLFIKFILPEFVSYLGEIGAVCERRRQWPSITSALGQCIVLSGVSGA